MMNNDMDEEKINSTNGEDDVRISKEEIVEIKKTAKESQFRKARLVSGIVTSVLGLILLLLPGLTMELICQFLGAALGMMGLFTIAVYFTQPEGTPMRGASLAAGIPLALLGLFVFLRPSFLIEFVPIVIGVLIILNGISDLLESFTLMKHGYGKWWVSFVFSIVTLILGLVLITKPFGIARFIMRLIGGVTLYDGLSDLYIALTMKKNLKDF